MKKTLVVIMAFCFMASWSAAVKVDDFESYPLGPVGAADPVWKTFGGTMSIAADPADPGNKVLDYLEPTGSVGIYGDFTGKPEAILHNGETRTLFFRVRQTGGFNSVLGMCPTVPVINVWTLAGPRVRWGGTGPENTNSMMATVGANWGDPATNLTPTMPAGVWYNVWIQANHTTNTFKVYKNAVEGADAVLTDRVGILASSTFCNNVATDMPYFQIISYQIATVHIYIDDMYVMEGESFVNPALNTRGAHDPTPTNGETNILITGEGALTTLSWKTGTDPNDPESPNPAITKHYVYMKAAGEPNFISVTVEAGDPVDPNGTCAISSFSPPITLARDKTYYWHVDESVSDSSKTSPNTIVGQVWSFDTEKSVPVLAAPGQPVSVRVSAPAGAEFTTVFTCVSTPTAAWYKNGAFYSTGTLTGPVGTTYTAKLTFATTSDSDQADYHCELLADGQDPEVTPATVSNTVSLVTKKLLAHYEFEGNLNDSSSYGPHNGTASGTDPNFATGLTYNTGVLSGTQAIVFSGREIVDLGTDAYPKGSFPANTVITPATTLVGTGVGLGAGMDEATIICWLKATSIGGLITNYNDGIPANTVLNPPQPQVWGSGFGMEFVGTLGTPKSFLRGEIWTPTEPTPPTSPKTYFDIASDVGVGEAFQAVPPFNMLGDGKWHQVAVSWKQGGSMVAYVDGVATATAAATAGTRDIFPVPQRGVVIGGIRDGIDRSKVGQRYIGMMDDLRVYNYEMTKYEIATLRYNVTGEGACIDTVSEYDLDGNCKVDLGDFMLIAANWLDCGFYPISTCN